MPAHPTFEKLPIVPRTAISGFLKDVCKMTQRTFPAWQPILTAGIEECTLTYDQRRAVLEVHPLDDSYFAGAVAMEASLIRVRFSPDETAALLGVLAEQVDNAAERPDRLTSDLLFLILSRIGSAANAGT